MNCRPFALICLIAGDFLPAQFANFLPGNGSFTRDAAAKRDLVQRPESVIHFADVLLMRVAGEGSHRVELPDCKPEGASPGALRASVTSTDASGKDP